MGIVGKIDEDGGDEMSVCIFKVLDDLKRHKGQKVEENVWEEGDWWLVM